MNLFKKINVNFCLINGIVINLLFVILCITVALLVNSTTIMLDGIFSLILLVFMVIIFIVKKVASKKIHSDKFQYQLNNLENLICVIKNTVLITLGVSFSLSSINSIISISNGNLPHYQAFNLEYILYFLISTGLFVYSLIVFWIGYKNTNSKLLLADFRSTVFDCLLTIITVFVLFSVNFIKSDNINIGFVRGLLDNSLVVGLSLIFIIFNIKYLIKNINCVLHKWFQYENEQFDNSKFEVPLNKIKFVNCDNGKCIIVFSKNKFNFLSFEEKMKKIDNTICSFEYKYDINQQH
ncbi:MAG: cation transporter [Mycoplasma sp.]